MPSYLLYRGSAKRDPEPSSFSRESRIPNFYHRYPEYWRFLSTFRILAQIFSIPFPGR